MESLQAQSFTDFAVIVVDNGSSDGSIELIEKDFPDVQIVKLSENQGFAGGVNRGIEVAIEDGAEFVALFNNDATADPAWLGSLVKTAGENPDAGIVTGKLLLTDKITLDTTGDQYSIWGWPFPRGRNEKDSGQYDHKPEVLGATGGASLYRISMLRQIGLFDEAFFAYFEDVDISLRAQLAGWKVLYEPNAIAYHRLSATSNKMRVGFTRYHTAKNFILLYNKNMPGWLFWKYLPRYLTSLLLFFGSSIKRRQVMAYLKGVTVGTLKLPYAYKKRRRIQSNRKVSLKYIDSILYHGWPPINGGIMAKLTRRKLPR